MAPVRMTVGVGARSAADLRAVLEYARTTLSVHRFDQVADLVLGGLAGLVGSDAATLTHLDLATGREVAVFWPSYRAFGSALEDYPRVARSHPLRALLARQVHLDERQRIPVRISDVLSRRSWKRSDMYAASHQGIDDQMSLLLTARGSAVHAITLTRSDGVFTDRQRSLFSEARVHIVAALERARRDGVSALQIAPEPMWVAADSAPGLGGAQIDPVPEPSARLTARELEVLELVASGLTDAQIGRRLQLSPTTVSKHLARIYKRVGLPNRAAATRYWSRLATLRSELG